MSDKTRLSVRHVATINDLPEKLTLGRVYFVNDEQYLIVDNGNGPVIYGARSVGPQGAPGEPLPELQHQIDELTKASIQNSTSLQNFNLARKEDIKNLSDARLSDLLTIYQQIANLSESVINVAGVISETCENLRAAEGTILKLLVETDSIHKLAPVNAGEQISTTDGTTWDILQSSGTKEEGTIIFSLKQ